MPELRRDGDVHVLNFGDDENRFSLDWLKAVHAALDQVVAEPAPLVTIGAGKFYSNGLDLDWLLAHSTEAAEYVGRVHGLLARMLVLPVPTVAAVNGHAFGAGAMLAMAHDFRLMRADRGFFCFPEVDIHIPFTPGMAALVQAKLTPAAAVASMTTARRFGGPDAAAFGIVDGTAAPEELLGRALAVARPLAGKDSDTLGAIKATMFGSATSALRDAGGAA
ncbi:enoyl-CoA hydratase-related protein [Amycolatopsis nigrescens]|uniref:enoyl-CoA hydratase-related protein n=1 Tax=Amycolatopsis nigrescens TaxID=381445 RepID=UPI0003649D61|nr:enoyl-CoA hydratase-related protein [Amycolatopsis nigrescens]